MSISADVTNFNVATNVINKALREEIIRGARNNLRAAAAYRKRLWHVPGVPIYDCGEDNRFANAMWQGCMNNARAAIRTAAVIKVQP